MRIAIIGAGINGLYLAWKLSEKGHKIVVFEKKDKIGQEACSGLFSERILNFFPKSRNLIKNEINYALVNFPEKTIKVSFSKPFFVMNHARLDKLAGDLAEEAGAEIFLNYNIKKIPQNFDKIIGADGPNSFVRKSLNLKNPKYRLGILGFAVQGGRGLSSDCFAEAWAVKRGFIWKIPRGENVEYGILAPINTAKKEFNEFLKNKSISLTGIQAKIIPQSLIIPNNKKITLVGDATGLTKPWSGGGVVWQLTAADILLKTFPNFKKYFRETKARMGAKLLFSRAAVSLVYFLGFNLPWILPENLKIESDFLLK